MAEVTDIFELMETWDRTKPDASYIGKHRNGTRAMRDGRICIVVRAGYATWLVPYGDK